MPKQFKDWTNRTSAGMSLLVTAAVTALTSLAPSPHQMTISIVALVLALAGLLILFIDWMRKRRTENVLMQTAPHREAVRLAIKDPSPAVKMEPEIVVSNTVNPSSADDSERERVRVILRNLPAEAFQILNRLFYDGPQPVPRFNSAVMSLIHSKLVRLLGDGRDPLEVVIELDPDRKDFIAEHFRWKR